MSHTPEKYAGQLGET